MKRTDFAQVPNLPIIVWFVATVLTHVLPYGKLNFTASLIAFGALFTWAWLEIFDGTNNFRRALGTAVMIILLVNRLYS
jgi:uncharacterized membrane protein